MTERTPIGGSSAEILAYLKWHEGRFRENMTRPEIGYWLVEIGRLQVELAEALVREAKR